MTLPTNKCMMRFRDRAERIDPKQIIETFVEVGPLLNVLESENNQVIYGRRGVGKTHALLYLGDRRKQAGDVVAYVDCRYLGSNISIYSDPELPQADKATRLLIDVCSSVHESLLDTFTAPDSTWNYSKIVPALDELLDAISNVKVIGTVETMTSQQSKQSGSHDVGVSVTMAAAPKLSANAASKSAFESGADDSRKIAGSEVEWIDFGGLARAFDKLTRVIDGRRIWFLIDEWSAIPADLQPYLADMFRRTVFVNAAITVKIAAIEHRSRFIERKESADYVGFELGADLTQAIDLDDYLVFDRDQDKATEFFRRLTIKHLRSVAEELAIDLPAEDESVLGSAFTQDNVFREFVVSTEGVPRDALHILQRAATKADTDLISMPVLKNAVLAYYQTDKYNSIQGNKGLRMLLEWVRDRVIGERRTRAFLLPVGQTDPIIDELFDRRALHILNRSMSAAHRPGERFVVYKLDYGCYVDLRATDKFPTGMLFAEENDLLDLPDVPDDDARSFRRAVLELDEFYRKHPELEAA